MELSIFPIDAFADRVFGGNPAAICPLDSWVPDNVMQAIAAENNLAETAFFVAEDSKDTDGVCYDLRWFTPTLEVELCGHATLATAFLIFERFAPDKFYGSGPAAASSPSRGRKDSCFLIFPPIPDRWSIARMP